MNRNLCLAAAGLAAGTWAYAAMAPESQLFGRTLIAGRDPAEVALTFDDGPNGDTTLRLLDVLASSRTPATFFLIGRFVKAQPHIVRAIAAAGHLIGNHTMTHPWLPFLSDQHIREELAGCSAAIEDVLGQPIRLFRAPHGARSPFILRYARSLGLTPVQWNIIVGDWRPVPPEVLVHRIDSGIARNRAHGQGTNLVLHDGGQAALGQPRTPTVEAVRSILAGFPTSGMRPLTLDAWL